MRVLVFLVLACALGAHEASASPNAETDTPGTDDRPLLFRPATERQLHIDEPTGWWLGPVRRLAITASLVHESSRPYSTPFRPRDVAGSLALSCERNEGRPCGDGAIGYSELDSAAGYRDLVSMVVRVRATMRTDGHASAIELPRGYLSLELGPAVFEAGRDVLILGPTSRTQLSWGINAPPLDQVRVATESPIALGNRAVAVEAMYLIGRLRAPQRYPGSLVTITRGQLDFKNTASLGLVQLLELGGDGAPSLGFTDFVLEHVRRGNSSASPTDTSNRRFGGDATFRIHELADAHFYYQLLFEDIRLARFVDALRYDADHLVGVRVRNLTLEWHQTGVRSQEHTPRTTGFSNGGFVVGSPLGPDAKSLFVERTFKLHDVSMSPWAEIAALSSDTYELIDHGPINPVGRGQTEWRYRLGARYVAPFRSHVLVEGSTFYERVTSFSFVPGSTRNNVGFVASVVWTPEGHAKTIALD